MLSEEILKKLISLSEEEINILEGDERIDSSIYHDEKNNIIDINKLLLPGEMISIRKHTRFIDYPEHSHNYLELIYVFSGTMVQVIGGKEVTLNAGEFSLSNCNVSHKIKKAYENDIIFNFIIRTEFFDYISTLIDSYNTVFNFILDALYSNTGNEQTMIFRVSKNEAIKNLIENIITTLYSNEPSKNIKIKLLVGLLLTEFTNNIDDVELLKSNSYDSMINIKILEYISKDYKEGSLAAISKILHQPTYKICKIIKKYTGCTFKQLIQETRLNKAENLLLSTNMPINDIMYEVGYENVTYFYKIFKEKYSSTPNEYRKTYKNKIAK